MEDVVIKSTSTITVNSITSKPCYLIKFVPQGKKQKLFIAVEIPRFEPAYIQAKGFFYIGKEESVYSKYNEIVNSSDKTSYVEMWLPWHTLDSVRSLVFKGDKGKK